MKVVSKKELANIVFEMETDEVLNFTEQSDQISFGIQKMKWLDNYILLIGGYHAAEVQCKDITHCGDEEEKEAILEAIERFFKSYGIKGKVEI